MNDNTDNGSKVDAEIIRLGGSFGCPASQGSDLRRKVDDLRIAVEATGVVMLGVKVDLSGFPGNGDPDLRRRWAAHLVILQNMFWEIERHSNDVRDLVSQLVATD
jgi:hypothetical protein